MDDNENKKHFGPGFMGAFATDQRFHDYILRDFCGCGAYGEVWQAEDISGRRLAIKIVSKQIYGSGWTREFNGIKNYCRLISSHPNLIRIMHVGEDDQYFFYTMELADNLADPGRAYYADTLADRLAANGPFASDQLVILTQHLLNGIGALHQAGLIHRDIKPANIIFINGVPKLSDIGFVAPHDANISLAGTVGFIPPEELLSENDSSAEKNCQYDIYALGKVMYCALTGLPPDEYPSLPESISFGLSKRLNQVICMACCKNPADRIAGVDEFRQLLMAAANGEEKLERQKNSKLSGDLPQVPAAKKMAAAAIILIVIIILGGMFMLGGFLMLKDQIPKNINITVSGDKSTPTAVAANTTVPSTVKSANAVAVQPPTAKQPSANEDVIPPEIRKTPAAAPQTSAGQPAKNSNWTVPELNMQMVYVEPGTFIMGDGKDKHRVTISKNFWIGKYEVTQQEYERLTGSNPSRHNGKRLPVECVSWNEASAFCDKLSKSEHRAGRLPDGYVYRLPTAAEWEYAARGGNKSKGYQYSGSNDINDIAWWANNSGGTTREAGTKLPNELGLYDMSGNVWELCLDWYAAYSIAETVDPVNNTPAKVRVICGGGYNDGKFPGYHGSSSPDRKNLAFGFRIVLAASIPGAAYVSPDTKTPEVPPSAINSNRTVPELNMPMIFIEPGTFTMGEGVSKHRVTISRDFWIGKYEVTQQEYENLTGGNPSVNKGDKLPVECVSWNEAVDFCKKLTEKENRAGRLPAGYIYRLPTEAEWEYAALGGNKSKNYIYSGSNDIGSVAWYDKNSNKKSHEIGAKQPNELGIHDMSGNVWEWCGDLYDSYSVADATDPSGPASGTKYVQRGGCWESSLVNNCRIQTRNNFLPYSRRAITGFRVALAPVLSGAAIGPVKDKNWSVPELGMELLYIRPGSFVMGSSLAEREWATGPEGKAQKLKYENDEPEEYTIHNAFWMGRTKVTVGQWRKFIDAVGYRTDAEKRGVAYCFDWQKHGKWMWMPEKNWRDPNYSYPVQDNFPATCISWNDAAAFCQWLTESEHQSGRLPQKLEYRLPAETEWEYACRGGKAETRFWWGNDWNDAAGRLNAAGSDKFPNGKSFQANYGKEDYWTFASPVDFYGEKGRNGFGLADMLGNTWEWCLDEADDNSTPDARILRGGAFDAPPGNLRSSGRICDDRSEPSAKYGFRIVCGAVENPEETVSTTSSTETSALQFPVWFYNGHYYRLFNECVSWNIAKKRCEEMGGYLVSIETPGENSFIYENIKAVNGVIFTGATYEGNAGVWRWSGSNKKLKILRWDTGQPVSNKDYAAFSPVSRKDRWASYDGTVSNDKNPGENTFGFICEWENAESANKSLNAKPAAQDESKKDSAVVQTNDFIIKIFTPRRKLTATKHLTLYAVINRSNKKYILCKDKNIGRGSTNIFVLQYPKDITEIGSITLEAETGDCWVPESFIFELPDNKIWTFTGQVRFVSSKAKIMEYNAQPSITFYFTGLKTGTIQTSNPYINKVPDWAPQVKGVCAVKTVSSQQTVPTAPAQTVPVPAVTPQTAPPIATTAPSAQTASNDVFKRSERRKQFMARYNQDRNRYNEAEMREIEELYQIANRNFNSAEAQESLKKLISKYSCANRTGCAVLYLGQMCPDRPQAEEYLRQAIANYSDCWYGNGVQVGAYARFYLAGYYRQSGKNQEAEKLYQEIREKYPDAVTHNGKPLVNEFSK